MSARLVLLSVGLGVTCSAKGSAENPKQLTCPAAVVHKTFYPGMAITTLATPYLDNGIIQMGRGETPSGPEFVFLGCSADGSTFPLGFGTQDAFKRLLAAAGSKLDSPGSRQALVEHHVQIIHGARLLESFEAFSRELSLPRNQRGKLKPASKRRVERLRKRYAAVLKPPRLDGASPWEIVVYALQGDRLLRLEISITHGMVEGRAEVVEKDLPVPMRI